MGSPQIANHPRDQNTWKRQLFYVFQQGDTTAVWYRFRGDVGSSTTMRFQNRRPLGLRGGEGRDLRGAAGQVVQGAGQLGEVPLHADAARGREVHGWPLEALPHGKPFGFCYVIYIYIYEHINMVMLCYVMCYVTRQQVVSTTSSCV